MSEESLSRAERELDRSIKALRAGTGSAVLNLGRIGRDTAKTVAPRQTGALANNIELRTKNVDGVQVFSKNPLASDHLTNPYRDEPFDLVTWMHSQTVNGAGFINPDAKRPEDHVRSGDAKYMFTAAERVDNLGGKVTEQELKKFGIR